MDRTRDAKHDDEHDLIRGTISGDQQAYGELVGRYQQRIFNLISRMVGRRDLVEDLAQEVFLKAYRKIGSFRFESSFYTWLYTIALNTCRNYFRRPHPVTVGGDLENNPEVVEHASGFEAPDEVVYRRQRAGLVREALDKLPPDQREALILCDLEGLGYQEIAEILGIPIGTVRSRIFRARAGMREHLPAEMGGTREP